MHESSPAYWLQLFTGRTWDEFRHAGANVTGFRQGSASVCERIRPKDILLCYLTGVKRWVGALEVLETATDESRRIWADDIFPVRLEVRALVVLEAVFGVPMEALEGKLAFFAGPEHQGGYRGFLRSSPKRFERNSDGELLMRLLKGADSDRIARPIDERAYRRRPRYLRRGRGDGQNKSGLTVPEPEPAPPGTEESTLANIAPADSRHTEMQWELLHLGSALGLDVWVANNDRGRICKGEPLSSTPRLVSKLPNLFEGQMNWRIELIDVLWLREKSIYAAFEIELTTSIHSGLLRMCDLIALQPNLNINLFIVAPDHRREKVRDEILRPTFDQRDPPLSSLCGYLPFSKVEEQARGIRRLQLAGSLKPDFLTSQAEYFGSSSGTGPAKP